LEHGFHLPDKVYCSPLSRALRTCEIMFDSFGHWERPQRAGDRGSSLSESTLNYGSYLETSFRQNCREENGEHTCDKRNTRTYIASTYPNFTIEDGFTEEDELWTPERETERHMEERARNVLDTIFEDDCTDNTCERRPRA
jgi:broad specificity phosphatase PhoE